MCFDLTILVNKNKTIQFIGELMGGGGGGGAGEFNISQEIPSEYVGDIVVEACTQGIKIFQLSDLI